MNRKIKVNNVSEYGKTCKYLVCRVVDGQAWFYGAWNDYDKALEVAQEIDGVVVEEAI